MSVPPDRMAARNPGPMKDPNKIMGLPKWAFFVIIAIGLVLAWYIWKRSQASNAASLQTANAGAQPDTTNGVTAADIGGTPADNSFATQTDAQALEEQIQALQNSLFQLQQSNGGNGAGLPNGRTASPGGSVTGQPITFPFPGVTPGGDSSGPPIPGQPQPPPSEAGIHWFGPGGSGVIYPGISPTSISTPITSGITTVAPNNQSFSEPIITQLGPGGSRATVGVSGLV